MIFDLGFSYWAFFGTFALVLLTYQDYKNRMLVDDRRNAFMLGITLSLLTHIPTSIWYIVFLIIITTSYVWIGSKFIHGIGEADFNSLGWIMIGLGIISVFKLFWFMIFFSIITLLYMGVKYIYCKYSKADFDDPIPFYPVILISFIFNCWLFGLY